MSDSIREGSGVSAEDEVLNKHIFCYNVMEESILPKNLWQATIFATLLNHDPDYAIGFVLRPQGIKMKTTVKQKIGIGIKNV